MHAHAACNRIRSRGAAAIASLQKRWKPGKVVPATIKGEAIPNRPATGTPQVWHSEPPPDQWACRSYGELVRESLQEGQETTLRKLTGQNWPDGGRQLSSIVKTLRHQTQSLQNASITPCKILAVSWSHVRRAG